LVRAVTSGRLDGFGLAVALERGPVLQAVPQRFALAGQRPRAPSAASWSRLLGLI
jgi:hypothetical protein